MKMKTHYLPVLLLSLIGFTACKKEKSLESFGESATYGNGMIQTYTLLDNTGTLAEVGVTFTDATLNNLPTTNLIPIFNYHTLSLDFPDDARQMGVTHLCSDFYPDGHPPAFAYGVPQIDFYWHFQTEAARLQVGLNPADSVKFKKELPVGAIPPTFIDPGGYIPTIGAHLVNAASPEFNGVPFKTGWIYGKYDGKLAFLENLYAMSFLKSATGNQSFDIPQPTVFPLAGKLFPRKYNILHDLATKTYKIFLSDFVVH